MTTMSDEGRVAGIATGLRRRRLLGAAVLAALAAPGVIRAQGAWRPARPVRLVVPYPPGGATDILARLVAQRLGDRFGQPIVVDNRPGANGIVGSRHVLSSPADGLTIMMATADTHTVLPNAYPRPPFPVQNFVPVAEVAKGVVSFIARPGLPVADAKELAERARRARPPLTYASWGVGSVSQVAAEMFRLAVGAEMQHIPYLGAAPGLVAVSADQVDTMMVPVAVSYPQRDKIRMLGVCSQQRFPSLPEVPTLIEQGIAVDADIWFGLLAARGTPEDALDAIHAGVQEVLRSAEFLEALRTNGFIPDPMGRAEFGAFLVREYERWGAVIRQAGIQLSEGG
jgi:tripartite-type tricarboxylate transporter receptor subunit TctC